MVLYFAIMWTSAFLLIFFLAKRNDQIFDYEMAVVQSFTAGSNNFGTSWSLPRLSVLIHYLT